MQSVNPKTPEQKISLLKKQALKRKFQWQLKKGYAIWQSGIVDILNNNGLAGLFDEILTENKKDKRSKWIELGSHYPKQNTKPKQISSPRIAMREKKALELKRREELLKNQIAQDKRRLRSQFLRDLGGLFEKMGGDALFNEENDQKKCEQLLFGALLEKRAALAGATDQTKKIMIKKWKDRGDALFKNKAKQKPSLIITFAKEPPLKIKQHLKKEYHAQYNPVRREWYAHGDLAEVKQLLFGLEITITPTPFP